MSERSPRQVRLSRVGTGRYRAVNKNGASLEFGSGDDLFSPVELLLAAIGGCSATDVDVVTSRHSGPEEFEVSVSADSAVDDNGAHKLEDVALDFHIRFGDDEAGRQAASLVERLVRLSHDKNCTVSRTVALPTSVTSLVDGVQVSSPR